MILILMLIFLLVGAFLAWGFGHNSKNGPRWISLIVLTLNVGLTLGYWLSHRYGGTRWMAEFDRPWIPIFGIRLHFAMDGLSLLLLLLTFFLGIFSVLCSWHEIQRRVGFFHFNLLLILAGITGVFMAMDLFLFYFFWELMLIPMYFLISLWGHERRVYASVKFFIFTQAGGLLMLLSILGLVVIHGRITGIWTFDYLQLIGTELGPRQAMFLLLGFFIAFAVKMPAVPLHTWLADAHTEAPTAGSVILAGLLLKTGAYGMVRFVVPLFPGAAQAFAPIAMALGVAGILYGAVLAFAQTDFKRLVAYTSISHMGFVLLGIFALNPLAFQGAVMQIICHGLSTGALFVIAGQVQERLNTRELAHMGGMWTQAPRISAFILFFALASLGLPGIGNFIGEFLILFGSYSISATLTAIAAIGLVVATIYSLSLLQRAVYGVPPAGMHVSDLSARETLILALAVIFLLGLGIYPRPVLDVSEPAMKGIYQNVRPGSTVPRPLFVGGGFHAGK
ncbi:MAG: NADH-quinone oxidoreductase subunit M [Candidatus Omnitrophota bacterium]